MRMAGARGIGSMIAFSKPYKPQCRETTGKPRKLISQSAVFSGAVEQTCRSEKPEWNGAEEPCRYGGASLAASQKYDVPTDFSVSGRNAPAMISLCMMCRLMGGLWYCEKNVAQIVAVFWRFNNTLATTKYVGNISPLHFRKGIKHFGGDWLRCFAAKQPSSAVPSLCFLIDDPSEPSRDVDNGNNEDDFGDDRMQLTGK